MKNWNIAILSTSILLVSLFCCSVCATEILTDEHGIAISKIDSPEYLINLKIDRGGALHNAQLSLLKNPDTSHPYYWAAFTLLGDFR